MKIEKIKSYLPSKMHSIYKGRRTTINGAFASAIAPQDFYNKKFLKKLKGILKLFGQNNINNLRCVYCDKPAEGWDHVFGLVKDGEFSGYGHVLGNLLPCCGNCNSRKRGDHWENFLREKCKNPDLRIKRFKKFFKQYPPKKIKYIYEPKVLKKYNKIKEKIFDLMNEADKEAEKIRKTLPQSQRPKET